LQVIDVRYLHVAGPKKHIWENDAPLTCAKERNRKINPEPDLRGEVLSGDEALRLLILAGAQSGRFVSNAFRAC
jgi:hypothetical protein